MLSPPMAGVITPDSFSVSNAVSLTPVTTTKLAARFKDEVEKKKKLKKKINLAVFKLYEYNKL